MQAIPDVETLYRRHAVQIGRWAERLAGHGTDIDDLVHQVFMIAQRRLPDFRGDAKVTTWLHGITVRVVQEARRRQKRWLWPSRRGADAHGSSFADDPTESLAADQPTALELLERREASRVVYQVLDQLDEKYRTALILFEMEGLTGQQIAEVTKTSLSNVWVRLLRGRQQFTKRFLAWEARMGGPAGERARRS